MKGIKQELWEMLQDLFPAIQEKLRAEEIDLEQDPSRAERFINSIMNLWGVAKKIRTLVYRWYLGWYSLSPKEKEEFFLGTLFSTKLPEESI